MRLSLPAAAAVALLTLLGACGRSPPSVTLTLDPVAPTAVRSDYRGPPLAVPAVHMPAAIDRAEFVRQVAPGEAKIDDFARWAAPLGTLARDALVRDLTARLPTGAVLPPGAVGGKGVRTLDVTVLALTGGPGEAVLQAAYRTVPGGAVQQVEVRAPATGDAPVPSAQAFGALIGKLADAIVAGLP